jgi:hypothetical protein
MKQAILELDFSNDTQTTISLAGVQKQWTGIKRQKSTERRGKR